MAFDKRNLDDYNDVASRMAEFFTKYPEGSFQSGFHFQEIGGRDVVIVQASAYRTPDDQRPGVGLAYEFIPGATPYTKDSELQNAETAAWGRAVVAVGAADTKKGIASREEVRNRQPLTAVKPNQEGIDALGRVCDQKGLDRPAVGEAFKERFGKYPIKAPNDELMSFALLLDEGAITLGVSG